MRYRPYIFFQGTYNQFVHALDSKKARFNHTRPTLTPIHIGLKITHTIKKKSVSQC